MAGDRRPDATAMLSRIRHAARDDAGQALAEFALVLPIMALLLFGIADLSKAWNYWNDTQHLSNVAARYAAVGKLPPGTGTFEENVRAMADSDELKSGTGPDGVVGGGLHVCTRGYTSAGVATTTPAVGDAFTVEVKADYHFLPLLNLGSTTIRGRATMRLEAVPPAGAITTCAPDSP